MSQSFLKRLPLSRFEVDRDYLTRERPDLFAELRANPATRVLPVHDGRALLKSDTDVSLLRFTEVPPAETLVYLGLTTTATEAEPIGTPVVAAQLADPGP